MADWSLPTESSLYTDVLDFIDYRLDDLATGFPTSGTYSNLPIGTIRWNSTSKKWEKWSGTIWENQTDIYSISISGTSSNITGTLAVANGGTNITTYTIGDIIYASAATSLSKLAAVASGKVLISNGVATAPSWGSVDLQTHTTSYLPVSKGGTGVQTLTGLIKANGTSAFSTAVSGVDYAAASHTHNYLDISGGSLTGNLSIINGTNQMSLTLGSSGGYWYGSSTSTGFYKSGGASFVINAISGAASFSNTLTVESDLIVNATITATGDISSTSDENVKTNITTINNALNKVCSMRGVNFNFIKDNKASTGVIAQEIEKIIPEVVNSSGEYKSVAYGNLVGVLIEAIKELNTKVERLENAG